MLKDSQVDLCGRTDFTRTAPLLARDEAFSFACALLVQAPCPKLLLYLFRHRIVQERVYYLFYHVRSFCAFVIV